MKIPLLLLVCATVCSAGEMIKVVDADFKRLDGARTAQLGELRRKVNQADAKDRDFLERVEQQFYAEPMMDISGPYFRQTRLRSGDDWRALWEARKSNALAELGGDKPGRASLEEAFAVLRQFEDARDARILERVVKARFGGESAWILLVHWERADAVERDLASGKEAEISHFLIIGIRFSDRKLVARIQCG